MNLSRPYAQEALERLDVEVLDRLAFGVTDGEIVPLSPGQVRIRYPGDLENPEHCFARGGMAWARSVDLSEPVEVSVAEDGGFDLEDGHHRWFAAQKTHRPLKAHVTIKGNPIRHLLAHQADGLTARPIPPRRTRRRG